MYEARAPLHRRWFPGLLLVVLLVLAGLAIWRFLALRQELYSREAGQLEGQIQDRVAAWEEALVEQLEASLDAAATDPSQAWLSEAQMRGRWPWFDSLYIWRPRPPITVQGQLRDRGAEFLFPVDPPLEAYSRVTHAECIRRQNLYELDAVEDPMQVVQTYVAGCRRDPLVVRMYASSTAGVWLYRKGLYEDALRIFESTGMDPDASLRAGLQQGIDPRRLVVLRLARADTLMQLGRAKEAVDLWTRTGFEITRLAAPELDAVQNFVPQIVRELREHDYDREADRLASELLQAERRVRAWQEIDQRILPRGPSRATEGSRFIYDQYNETPFLLYYGPVRNGELGAALQLDQPLLVQDFLASMRRYRDHLVITDASGAWVAGERSGGDIAVQVPFSRTLTHLRVGLRQEALEARLARLDDQWIIPLFIVLGCVLLGLVALFAQVRADRQLQLLLQRQRDFTARVTHELKTPLAGIRVMAENLEAGAYNDKHQQRDMAGAIVREADRLAQRVEEILAVAKERKLPDPEPFDPEEAALEAIDQWGPRLEQAGIRLHADLHPTDQVLGDGAAIRDALGCLLDNALKYRREQSDTAAVWLTLQQHEGRVVFDVSDNGIGVPHAMREAIFERFVRVEGPHRGLAGGHGLGLAQVREVMEAHRGRVYCVDGVEGGARFVLELPALS